MLVNISAHPGSAGGCDVMLVCAVKSFTPAQSKYQVLAKPLAAGWLRGVASSSHHHHREQGRVQLAQPLRCQSVLVDSLKLFTSLLTKPLQNPLFTSFVGGAELEIRAAFSRCWCENVEFTRCQSGSEGMMGISVVYTNLHKNEVSLVSQKIRCLSPYLFFPLLEQKISPHSSLSLFKYFL